MMNDKTPKDAAELMARIIYTDLDLEVSPSELRAMIKRGWTRIAPLAHEIHDAPDNTKTVVPPPPVLEAKRTKPKHEAAARLRTIAGGMEMNGLGLQASSLREVIAILEGKE